MRILVVGSGGREHAIAHSLSASPGNHVLFAAPGNAGIREIASLVPIPANDIENLVRFAREEQIDLTVAGPEQPLVAGIADRFRQEGLAILGPDAAAARLEGSKAFAKAFMQRRGIPTARYRTFRADEYDEAVAHVRESGAPVAVKASGLAAGKGAVMCATVDEAVETLGFMLREQGFGAAGAEVVVEEYMEGEEASVFALCDGEEYLLFAPAQDHKRIGEGDTGPNTGGMGAYAPVPLATDDLLAVARNEIVEPTLHGMAAEGHPYRGILYCGLMVTEEGPKVIEYNCRFGDPEAQAVLPLLASDAADAFEAAARGALGGAELTMKPGAAACVVLASGGYPGRYETGFPIRGLEEARAQRDVMLFYAGAAAGREDGARADPVTSGGRVLGVTGLGRDLREALDRAYGAVDCISFEGMQFRRDIGKRGLRSL